MQKATVSDERGRSMRDAFQKVVGGMLRSFRSVFHSDRHDES
jgi:hypothetical protein